MFGNTNYMIASSTALYAAYGLGGLAAMKLDGTSTPISKFTNALGGQPHLSVDGGTLVLSNGATVQTYTVSPTDGSLTLKQSSISSQGWRVAATSDLIFTAESSVNSNSGIVYVIANTAAPTPSPISSPTPSPAGSGPGSGSGTVTYFYNAVNWFSASDCSGSPGQYQVNVYSDSTSYENSNKQFATCTLISANYALLASAGGTTPPALPNANGLLQVTFSSASNCAAGTPLTGESINYSGVCTRDNGGGSFSLLSCTSPGYTYASYSDTACKTPSGSPTFVALSPACTENSDGSYSTMSCISASAPAAATNNALAIGLGVGLGGGAVVVGGGLGLAYMYMHTVQHPQVKIHAEEVL